MGQTPWLSNIDAAGYQLNNLASITAPSGGVFGISASFYMNMNTGYFGVGNYAGTLNSLYVVCGSQRVGIGGNANPSYPLDVTGDCNITGVYRVNGVQIAAANVTNAVSTTGSYSDPAWITGLSWSKILSAPNFLVNPLTTKGDLITYTTAVARLAVGTNNQVLVVDSTQAAGIKWAAVPVMVASGASHASGAVPDPSATAGTTRFLREDATWVAPVASFNTRTGAVVPVSGDYTAAMVTNAVDTTQTYPNPAWITSIAWSKVTGAPAFVTGAAGSTGQVQFNNAGAFAASANLFWDNTNSRLGIGTASPQMQLDIPAYNNSNSQVRVGSFEIQAVASHNSQIADNIYWNGSNWVYRTAGPGTLIQLSSGTMDFSVFSTGTAGATANANQLGVIGITNTGRIVVGNTAIAPVCLMDSPLFNTSNSQFRVGSLEIQPYALNSNVIGDNIFWNGSAYQYRNTGVASVVQTSTAGISIGIFPSQTGGTTIAQPTATCGFNATYVELNGMNLGIGGIPSHQLELTTDSAAKPTTNTWTITSDARVKQNAKWLEGGLDIINQIHPVEADYNGLHNTPAGQRVVSFVVEELRKILPGCVPSHRGRLRDGEEETDILDFNSHEILFQLILAVQQLSALVKDARAAN
jgi:hypothetical protein